MLLGLYLRKQGVLSWPEFRNFMACAMADRTEEAGSLIAKHVCGAEEDEVGDTSAS